MTEAGAAVADRRVHPATVPIRGLKEAPSALIGLPAAFAWISDVGWGSVLVFAGVVALLLILVNWLAWRKFRYGVGASEIVIESGLLHRNRRSIPFERIQDVDIERGPLQRLFNLAKVRIETGGGGKDEGVLDSVSLAEAERVRAAVRAWRSGAVDGARAAGADVADAAPGAQGRELFAMALPRVLLVGLFNFSLVWIAGLFALLQSFDNFLPFDIYDPARWIGMADARLAGQFTLGAAAAVLFLALVLGVIAGIARTVARDYGFRLSVEGERFRRERGLFTHTEIVLPKSRVQLVRVQTGPVRARLGWSELFFQTLSAGRDGGGHQSVAPLALGGEIEPIIAEQGSVRLPQDHELEMVSSRHLLRILVPHLLVPLAAITGLAVVWRPAPFLLALLPPLVAIALLERRFHRYGLAGDLLFVRRGVWRRQLWIIPLAKGQTVRLTRSFLQQRLGLASLLLDTAGAPMMNAPAIVDLREAKARALADALAGRLRLYSGRKSGTDR